MKILLITTNGEGEDINRVRPLLEKMNAEIEIFPVMPQDETGGDIRKQFAGFLNLADSEEKEQVTGTITHMLIVSPIAQRYLDFIAGFSYGSRLPVLVYGEEAIAGTPVEFASFFRFLKTENSLNEYFEAESEAFEKWKAASIILQARDALLQMGIPVTGESLAFCAGESGVREVSLFLAAGFSPETRNKAGVPLLNIAARKGNQEILRLLIQAGVQLNIQADDRGTSALIDSVMSKQHGILDDLIKAGTDLNIKSKSGQTALVVAVGAGDEKMVEALLKAGADADIIDNLGVSARKYANLFRNTSITALFDTYAPQTVQQ